VSPGSVKFGSAASATFAARPRPVSSMPPHHTGTSFAAHTSCTRRASRYPPTRPAFTLTMRQAPSAIASSAPCAEVIDSSRQIGVCTTFASSACPRRSSSGSGCSISSRSRSSSCASRSASSSVYAAFASTWSRMSPKRSRTARTCSTSYPGSIFSLMRR